MSENGPRGDGWAGKSTAEYSACRAKASAGDCHAEQVADVCEKSPKYASCNDYSSFADYFVAIGGLFCTTGFGTDAQGGAAEGGAAEGGAAEGGAAEGGAAEGGAAEGGAAEGGAAGSTQ